ncbi:hypothetical protein DFH07DRAFT_801305 [Mycena maculata]|uniref:F-box domain-containing protein n=1 Tax=Mycena maculata TaxID=230809 RepID=A0AAD7JZ83_9AGAR|nr:hypothetical protein DFH07DRAFT_801305 [Mycena maculata]
MVLTRRGHKARMMVTRLPNEIITEIVRAAPKADQATLCRVSKFFHSLVLPVLNRVVEPARGNRNNIVLAGFCSALIADPGRAHVIRSFTFFAHGLPTKTLDVLVQAMNLMSRLEHLSINHPSSLMLSKLSLLTFPGLLSFHCPHVYERNGANMVAGLLTRHPTLIRIQLRSPPVPISLPNLQYFDGFARSIPLITTQSLRAVRLVWDPATQNFDDIFMALLPLRDFALPFVSSHVYCTGNYKQILPSLARRMPHTTSLQIVPSLLLNDEIVNHVTQWLPELRHLVYLALDHIPYSPKPRLSIANPQVTVQAWAKACPTLEGCSLVDSAWRKVDGTWQGYSLEDFRIHTGFSEYVIT